MLQLILVVVVFAALLYYYGIKPMSYWTDRGVKQGSPLWIVGDSWKNLVRLESISELVERVYQQVPGVRYSGMYQFATPTLVLKDPELIKQITVRDFDHFVDHKPLFPVDMDPSWEKNLFALRGQKWREMRAILSPSFTGSKMRSMFVLISECAQNFSEFFREQNREIIELEMKDIFTRYTNDIIATTAFGIRTDSLRNQTNEFYIMGRELTNFSGRWKNLKTLAMMLVPKLAKIFKFTFIDKHITEFFTEIITNTIKTREERGIIRPDMIHLLMEARKESQQKRNKENSDRDESETSPLTDIDIVAQALVFFLAGFDTVATLMSFMSHELAVNPDVQGKLRREINETLEECEGSLTYDALQEMKYMDMVLSETLRKWPSVTVVDRICTKPYTIAPASSEEKPLDLKEGDVIWLPFFGIHRDPEIYPDPERFDPERFSEENKATINPYQYLPFGVGPRNCIGNRFGVLETKIVIFNLLSHFEIVPIAKTKIPLVISKKQFTLHPEGGFWLGLKRLQK